MDKIKRLFNFVQANKKGFIPDSPESLVPLEKEHKVRDKIGGHLVNILKLAIGIWLLYQVVIQNIYKLADTTLISQEFSLVKKTSLNFKMDSQTLPVHFFTTFLE